MAYRLQSIRSRIQKLSLTLPVFCTLIRLLVFVDGKKKG